jgi:ABC-type hemin transport system ATPase subunit
MDTDKWHLVLKNEDQRQRRHKAILLALRDSLLSPSGAMTATMLPHLTGLMGAIVVRSAVGRAPTYSALSDDFITRLEAMRSEMCIVYPFETVDVFNMHMNHLIQASYPYLPASARSTSQENASSEVS